MNLSAASRHPSARGELMRIDVSGLAEREVNNLSCDL